MLARGKGQAGPLPVTCLRRRQYHFDRFGGYLGYIDEIGQYYDKNGAYGGAVSDTGDFFDQHGIRRGRVDLQGQYWDEHGGFRGYFRTPTLPHHGRTARGKRR